MRTRMPLNQNGSSLIIVMVVVAVIGVSAVFIMSMSDQKKNLSQQMNVSASAGLAKQKLVGLILSPQSWQATQAHNSQAFAGFNPQQPPALDVYTPSDTSAYYPSTNPAAGFDLKGNPCTGFSANGNDNCPFRYTITLKNRVFQNSNWIDTLHFELSFKPGSTSLVLNARNAEYTFDLVRNLNEQSVESACISIHGVYNADTNSCSAQLTKATSACAGNQTYRGPASNYGGQGGGTFSCATKLVTATACTGGQVIKGFNTAGEPVCGAAL